MLIESITILSAVLMVYIINNSPLLEFSSYILAILIIFSIIYITLVKRSKKREQLFTGSLPEVFGFVSVVLLIVTSTNGLSSPLFFFLYFVLFGISFLARPASSLIFLLGIILYFIPEAFEVKTTENFIKLGSLVLIGPIAYFFGREYERRSMLSDKIEAKTDEIITEAQALREDGHQKDQEEIEAIDEIIEEAQSLKTDSKD